MSMLNLNPSVSKKMTPVLIGLFGVLSLSSYSSEPPVAHSTKGVPLATDTTNADPANYALCLAEFNKLEKGQVLAGICSSLCETKPSLGPSRFLEAQMLRPLKELIEV